MNAEEFSQTLRELGLSKAEFSRRLGVSPNTVSRWAVGELAVPQYAVYVTELLKRNQNRAEMAETLRKLFD